MTKLSLQINSNTIEQYDAIFNVRGSGRARGDSTLLEDRFCLIPREKLLTIFMTL